MRPNNIQYLGKARKLIHKTFRRELRQRLLLIIQECHAEGFGTAYVLRQLGEQLIHIANEVERDDA